MWENDDYNDVHTAVNVIFWCRWDYHLGQYILNLSEMA